MLSPYVKPLVTRRGTIRGAVAYIRAHIYYVLGLHKHWTGLVMTPRIVYTRDAPLRLYICLLILLALTDQMVGYVPPTYAHRHRGYIASARNKGSQNFGRQCTHVQPTTQHSPYLQTYLGSLNNYPTDSPSWFWMFRFPQSHCARWHKSLKRNFVLVGWCTRYQDITYCR